MSENININVLVAAKEEYTKQLVYILSPEIYTILLNVFNDSQLLKKKRSISLRNFQISLKKIPLWNTLIIEKNNEIIKTKYPYLLDLITAIFVSHVKILACVKLNNDTKSIDVKVPNLDHFLHKIIVTIAENIYYNPDVILKKKELVINLISDNIEQTIRNQIPIDKILTEYLVGVFEDEKINSNINFENNNNNNSIKQNIDEDSDDEDSEDEESEDEELSDQEINDNEEQLENKNIVPTRPLPINQIDNDSIPIPYNNNNNNNNLNQETINHDINNGQQIINKKVLFSDATSKEKKHKTDDDDDDDDDDDEESEIDFNSDLE